MSDEQTQKTASEIRHIIGQYTYLSTAQRELLNAVFVIREGMDEEDCKDVFRQLVEAKLVPQGNADSIRKRIYEK